MKMLFAAAPWRLSTDSPVLLCVFGVALAFLILLVTIGKVPLSYNLMNLRVRWHTSIMTVAAFILVIALQTFMLAFVNGMYAMTDSTGQPGNVLILSEGSTDEGFSNLGFADASDLGNQEGVLKVDGEPLVSRETYLNIVQTNVDPVAGQPKRRFLQVRGVNEPVLSGIVHGMKLQPGGDWFTDAGVREVGKQGETAIEVVLGSGIAGDLGADRKPEVLATAKNRSRLEIGDTFDVGGRPWVVTGVMEPTGSLYDSEVWTKQSQIGALFSKPNYTTFVVRADANFRRDQRETYLANRIQKAEDTYQKALKERAADPTLPKPVKEIVKRPTSDEAWGAELLRDYFANEYKKASLSPYVETKFFSGMSSTNEQFLIASLFLSGVISLGGIFGVMNTMFAAISQRTKDIGVFRLLGYKRWQILVSFLFESIVLAIVGGLIGCAVGSTFDGLTVSSVVSSSQGGGKFILLRMTVDFSTLALGMLLAVAMGFLGGLFPAVSAMRLTALESLR